MPYLYVGHSLGGLVIQLYTYCQHADPERIGSGQTASASYVFGSPPIGPNDLPGAGKWPGAMFNVADRDKGFVDLVPHLFGKSKWNATKHFDVFELSPKGIQQVGIDGNPNYKYPVPDPWQPGEAVEFLLDNRNNRKAVQSTARAHNI